MLSINIFLHYFSIIKSKSIIVARIIDRIVARIIDRIVARIVARIIDRIVVL